MEFDRYTPEPEPPAEPPARRRRWPWVVAVVVVVILAGVVTLLVIPAVDRELPTEPARPEPAAPPAPAAPAAEAPVELPRLAESDDWLRRIVAELSTHPDLARWLVNDNLARRFTAAVDNVARGESPRPHLGFLAPSTGFAAVERGGGLYPDPASYERYNRVTEVVDSIDAAGAAELYRRLEPLLQEGYADLGYPDREFADALAAAIDHLLATPLVDRPRLEPGVESHAFRDPRLEGLSPAQKHLLRMGPDNARVVLDKLRQIRGLLGLAGG